MKKRPLDTEAQSFRNEFCWIVLGSVECGLPSVRVCTDRARLPSVSLVVEAKNPLALKLNSYLLSMSDPFLPGLAGILLRTDEWWMLIVN